MTVLKKTCSLCELDFRNVYQRKEGLVCYKCLSKTMNRVKSPNIFKDYVTTRKSITLGLTARQMKLFEDKMDRLKINPCSYIRALVICDLGEGI